MNYVVPMVRIVAASLLVLFVGCGGCSGNEESDCESGASGCECVASDECDGDLLCSDGQCTACADELGNCMPESPRCYTPCSSDVTDDNGTVRICDDDGLLEGCLTGAVCDGGTCVPIGIARALSPEQQQQQQQRGLGTCKTNPDCADFQACVDDRCVSTCQGDEDCAQGATCFRHVCRATCTETNAVCDEEGFVCSSGKCVPTVPAEGAEVDADSGSYTLNVEELMFHGQSGDRTLRITNTTTTTRVFHVSKASEMVFGDGAPTVINASDGGMPLPWLTLGAGGAPTRTSSVAVTIPALQSKDVTVGGATNDDISTWRGALEVRSDGLQNQTVRLSYSSSLQGAWTGRMYTFGSFEDGANGTDRPLDDWVQNRSNIAALESVPNAFLSAWGRFRNNAFSIEEFRAILRGTLDESWKQARVKELCREAGYGPDAICVPFGGTGSKSVLLYSSAGRVRRVPSGIVELDFTMNVREARADEIDSNAGCGANPSCFIGKIDSSNTLQYAGDPELTLSFEGSPQDCATGDAFGCRADMSHFASTITMGGRYVPTADDTTCDLRRDINARSYPWLVSGFAPRAVKDGVNGGPRTRTECVDGLVPSLSSDDNADLARANPVPDGLPRVRHLEMIDGFVVNQQTAFILVRETVEPFVPGGEALKSYAFIALDRQSTDLDNGEFEGSQPLDDRAASDGALGLSCDPELIATVTGLSNVTDVRTLTPGQLSNLARAVIRGDTSAAGTTFQTTDQVGESVHYVCVWDEQVTGGTNGAVDAVTTIQRQVFDAGAQGTTTCPPQARVVYFALDDADFGPSFDPAALPCNANKPETCLHDPLSTTETLSKWVAQDRPVRLRASDKTLFPAAGRVQFDLVGRCDDGNASCDNNPFDLTDGKTFLEGNLPQVFFSPIEQEIRDAFRYKTQFVSRTGATVGFAPEICRGGAELTPYCYDPQGVAEIQRRVDCALAIYDHHVENDVFDRTADAQTLDTLRGYLDKNFSQLQNFTAIGDPVVEHGFERLFAELLIMQGDDAYTNSFASRFDLAGASQLAFEGDRFEKDGIKLSGGAGFELYSLYRATQYYEMVLDRFYELSPVLWRNVTDARASERFISQKTVTSWLTRVARASTQNAAAWSQIARRYQQLNRPDLARRVLARAYARSFTESTILSDFLLNVTRVVSPAEVDQLIISLDETRVRYRVAMSDMKQAFDGITDNVNFFGLPPDLVPFPALGEDDVNGFEVLIERARESFDRAADFEARALEQQREFDTDSEAFRAELVGLRLDYEGQLGQICGTFIGDDGRVYPAISRYAHLDSQLAVLDDPCGAVGNGDVYLAAADLETTFLELQKVRQQMVNLNADFADNTDLIKRQCALGDQDVTRFLSKQQAVDNAQGAIDSMNLALSIADQALDNVATGLDFAATIAGHVEDLASLDPVTKAAAGGKLISAAVSLGIWGIAVGAHFTAKVVAENDIRLKEKQIRDRERAYEAWTIQRECKYLEAEGGATVRAIQREMDLAELDSLNAIWNIEAQLGIIRGLSNERVRLESAWAETDQLILNAAAAASDPNIRIFKNDAIIGADRTFQRALRDTYRVTRMYEYYTSSSYANFEQLFLARLINSGQYNLRRYLDELEESFFEFEQQYGNPDTRITQVSLRDDILKVPRYSEDQRVLTMEERANFFRDAISSEDMLNESGHLAFEFSTTFDELSPLTANHKILFMEVEILGDDVGDNVGRVYVRQLGTGVVRDLSGESLYYAFPPMAAVMNPVFNGDRAFGQDADGAIAGPVRSIFRSFRFRDRPVVQTRWELVLNQRDELVNDDINLSGLDDIVLTIFYTDFTP